MKDIRDAFFDEVAHFAMKDPDVVILTTDMQVNSLVEFQLIHSDRFINIGVSEQNIMNVAAGLASTGKKVIVFGILSFLTTRCYEQLKINICEMNLPVLIVGIGTGLSFSFDGTSHHSTSDISLIRQLPNVQIYNPICADSAALVATEVMKFISPTLVRLDKGTFPQFKGVTDIQFDQLTFQEEHPENVILITGTITEFVEYILNRGQLPIDKFEMFGVVQVWPLSKTLEQILAKASKIVIVEENTKSGGLFSIVSEYVADKNFKVEIVCYALNSSEIVQYGSRAWLRKNFITKI